MAFTPIFPNIPKNLEYNIHYKGYTLNNELEIISCIGIVVFNDKPEMYILQENGIKIKSWFTIDYSQIIIVQDSNRRYKNLTI